MASTKVSNSSHGQALSFKRSQYICITHGRENATRINVFVIFKKSSFLKKKFVLHFTKVLLHVVLVGVFV